MIPKIIHYCWFGGTRIPVKLHKYMDTWKKFLPDYELVRWDESNFPIEDYPFAKQAHDVKKYAFVTDVARLHALEKYGGIYLDTDVEVMGNLDGFLGNGMFFGMEKGLLVGSAIIGAVVGHALLGEMLNYYKDKPFVKSDNDFDFKPNTEIITELLSDKFGLECTDSYQDLDKGIVIYPSEIFYPKDYLYGKTVVVENTVTIHHYSLTWHSPKMRIRKKMTKIIGKRLYEKIKKIKGKMANGN